jgi:hypothetical protein
LGTLSTTFKKKLLQFLGVAVINFCVNLILDCKLFNRLLVTRLRVQACPTGDTLMSFEQTDHRTGSVFRSSLDRGRPYVLNGEYSESSAVIRYTYTDTGESVAVPNNWANRPANVRAEHARRKAAYCERKALELTENPPEGLCREALECVIDRHYYNAERYWDHCDQIMEEPGATYQGGKIIGPEMGFAA